MVADRLTVEVSSVSRLQFADGSPVRAASAIVPFRGGWLVAQDDSNHAAWQRPGRETTRVRLFPPTDGHDEFSEAAGTKHLKADIEMACVMADPVSGASAALLMGSGSTDRRMRGAWVTLGASGPVVECLDLSPLYALVAETLELPMSFLNLEGAAVSDGELHLFNRGVPAQSIASQSVIVDEASLLKVLRSPAGLASLEIRRGPVFDLGTVDGVGLSVTDAMAIGSGRFLLSAAAEDTASTYDDGLVVGSAIVVADRSGTLARGLIPPVEGRVAKVEGLALIGCNESGATLLAVVDDDDTEQPSLQLTLTVRW